MRLFVCVFVLLFGAQGVAPDGADREDQQYQQRRVGQVRSFGEQKPGGYREREGGHDDEYGQHADDFFDLHRMFFLISTLQTYERIFEKQLKFIVFR